jgi:hypothetical protein
MRENWVVLIEAENDIEAEIICGMLTENGIPVRKADSSPYTGALRVIGGMAYEVVIMVPDSFAKEARILLESYRDHS